MTPDDAIGTASRSKAPVTPEFTVERANRALVLVRKIVAEIVARYGELMGLRAQRDRLLETPGQAERAEFLGERIAACVENLNARNCELTTIGCVLKDWRTGLVDFPATHEGHRVWLCWRYGEPTVAYWHDLHDGVAGRKRIEDDFR